MLGYGRSVFQVFGKLTAFTIALLLFLSCLPMGALGDAEPGMDCCADGFCPMRHHEPQANPAAPASAAFRCDCSVGPMIPAEIPTTWRVLPHPTFGVPARLQSREPVTEGMFRLPQAPALLPTSPPPRRSSALFS